MSVIIDVAIGVVFLFLLLALVVTTTQELLATLLGSRANNLYDAIESMLKGGIKLSAPASAAADAKAADTKAVDLVTAFYAHPLIKNLAKTPSDLVLESRELSWWKKRAMPSYIPSKTFAIALLDVLRGPGAVAQSATQILAEADQTLARIENEDLKRALSLFVQNAAGKVEDVEKRAERIRDDIEEWFNDRMTRASGWYKSKAQLLSFVIAAVVVVVFNADSVHVANRLWQDGALRDSVAAAAAAFKQNGAAVPADGTKPSLSEQSETIRSIGFPIGWRVIDGSLCMRPNDRDPTKCWEAGGSDYALLLLGWLVTTLAVSLGSNFWFDVLGKALQLRGSGPKVSVATGEVEAKKT